MMLLKITIICLLLVLKRLELELFQQMFSEYYRNHNEFSLCNTWWFYFLIL